MPKSNDKTEFIQQGRRKRKKYKRKDIPPQQPKPSIPTKPSFASIIKKNNVDTKTTIIPEQENIDVGPTVQSFGSRRLAINYVPRRGNRASYDTWVFSYFSSIIELRNIVVSGIKNSSADVSEEWLYSFDFLENLCQFMYEYSSGTISPYLDELSDDLFDYYYEFMIKRNMREY